jgi:uncharacterized protein YjbI with pentapeptide repeats
MSRLRAKNEIAPWLPSTPLGWVACAVIALLVIAILVVALLPKGLAWIAGTDQNSMRTAVLAMLAGGLAAVGAVYTARSFTLNREGQITERFTRAVDQLGHDEDDVRVGGIYALERIARDSAADHPAIMEVLTAYVGRRSRAAATRSQDEGDASQQPEGEATPGAAEQHPGALDRLLHQQLEQPADIQAALTVLARRETSLDVRPLDLSESRLEGADLRAADLKRANLFGADLKGAYLHGADLENAYLVRANLKGADLGEAHLKGAYLRGAHLERAYLRGAHLEGAYLRGVHLEGADLSAGHLERAHLPGAHLEDGRLVNAHLERANLEGTHLERANLAGASLVGAGLPGASLVGADLMFADLRDTDGLADANFQGAIYNRDTHWPGDPPPGALRSGP